MAIIEESWGPEAKTLGFPNETTMLKHLYLEEECSIHQIAKILGYSPWSVRRRLLMLRVPLRSRGGAANRAGRRKLKDVSDEELKMGGPPELAVRYDVSEATVFAEKRLRRAMLGEERWNSVLSPPLKPSSDTLDEADTT